MCAYVCVPCALNYRSGLNVSDLEYVELLGGGTRVPRLQTVLSEVLGGRTLDRHVDADEAVSHDRHTDTQTHRYVDADEPGSRSTGPTYTHTDTRACAQACIHVDSTSKGFVHLCVCVCALTGRDGP